MEQVHAMLRMFDEMDNHYGGGGIRTSIVQYLTTEVIPLLQQRGVTPQHRRELFAAAARLAAMAGWSSYDAGEYGLAQRYMTQGLRLCAEGRDHVLGGQILAIVDIFEALTAKDRPYKPAIPVEKAIQITQAEVDRGALNAKIWKLFLDKKLYQLFTGDGGFVQRPSEPVTPAVLVKQA